MEVAPDGGFGDFIYCCNSPLDFWMDFLPQINLGHLPSKFVTTQVDVHVFISTPIV